MKFMTYGCGWPGSNRYWFRRTRTLIARLLALGGHGLVDLAEWVAPWASKPDPTKPPARTEIQYGDYERRP